MAAALPCEERDILEAEQRKKISKGSVIFGVSLASLWDNIIGHGRFSDCPELELEDDDEWGDVETISYENQLSSFGNNDFLIIVNKLLS